MVTSKVLKFRALFLIIISLSCCSYIPELISPDIDFSKKNEFYIQQYEIISREKSDSISSLITEIWIEHSWKYHYIFGIRTLQEIPGFQLIINVHPEFYTNNLLINWRLEDSIHGGLARVDIGNGPFFNYSFSLDDYRFFEDTLEIKYWFFDRPGHEFTIAKQPNN